MMLVMLCSSYSMTVSWANHGILTKKNYIRNVMIDHYIRNVMIVTKGAK